MANINRLSATLLLIRTTLFPSGKAERSFVTAAGDSFVRVPPEAFPAVLRALDSCLHPDGRLELLFEGVYVPAAPFLLYRLKRNGFSECKAVIVPEGIMVTARR